MNALANSQLEELKKFLGADPGTRPVTFGRFTGQESTEEQEAMKANPPDILLTNFMMLELLLTRQNAIDQQVIANAKGLKFLVLDELHTYRGRQGADVALLVRRVREALADQLVCIGTSATMATDGTEVERNAKVAEVASRLFGTKIPVTNIITETLKRTTPETETLETITPRLAAAIQAGVPQALDFPAMAQHPVPIWVELTLGLTYESGKPRRLTPIPMLLTCTISAFTDPLDLIARAGRMSARTAQQPQPIADHQEAGPHVRKNRHPHRRVPKDRNHQEHRLDAQRQHDVLKKDAPRAPGELDDFGDAAQIIVHDDDVRSLHGRVGSCRTHGQADVGACQRRGVVDAISRHRRGAVLGLHLLNGR